MKIEINPPAPNPNDEVVITLNRREAGRLRTILSNVESSGNVSYPESDGLNGALRNAGIGRENTSAGGMGTVITDAAHKYFVEKQ